MLTVTRLAAGQNSPIDIPQSPSSSASEAPDSPAPMLDEEPPSKAHRSLLLAARDHGRLVGTQLTTFPADRTAYVFPPELVLDAAEASADALLHDALDEIRRSHCLFAQAVLPMNAELDAARLIRCGFRHITDVLVMSHDLERPEAGAHGARGLRADLVAEPYTAGNRPRFLEALAQSNVDSLDCPEASALRTPEQTLESHRLAGESQTTEWRLYRTGREDVGVLLLTARPEELAGEVLYLGVHPAWRGRGLGRAIVRDGLQRARQADWTRLYLAVDARNSAAIDVYRDTGFEIVDRRRLLLRAAERP